MDGKKYLSEEQLKKSEKTIKIISLIVLIIGIFLGGFFIYRGIAKPGLSKVKELEKPLKEKKIELEAKGIEYVDSAENIDGEVYDYKIIVDAMDSNLNYCAIDQYKKNTITKGYCAAKNATTSFASATQIMIGAFVCITALIISLYLFLLTKQKNKKESQPQQVMPVAKEASEQIAPPLGQTTSETSNVGNNNYNNR